MKTPRNKGFAIVIVLCFLVLLTILIVGFATSMRLERQASRSVVGSQKADLLARSAVNHAAAILDRNIPAPRLPGESLANPTNWIINPGLLTTVTGTSTTNAIPLSSNPSASYASTANDANLNGPLLDGTYPIGGNASNPMRVAWVNVLENPAAPASATNKITGRYAFWMDDENAKVNINTAYGRPTLTAAQYETNQTPGVVSYGSLKYPLGHPSAISLAPLGIAANSTLVSRLTTGGPFSTLASANSLLGNATVTANRFNLTTFNRDPEFNVFGKSRVFMLRGIRTMGLGRLGTAGDYSSVFPGFQYDWDKDGMGWFHLDDIRQGTQGDTNAGYALAQMFANLFQRNDWPGMPARSFVDKWGGAANPEALREADQIAWNLVGFGNYAAYAQYLLTSVATVGPPPGFTGATVQQATQFANQGTIGPSAIGSPTNLLNRYLQKGPLSGKAILMDNAMPKINEIGFNAELEFVSGTNYRLKLSPRFEIWNPPGFPRWLQTAASSDTWGLGFTYFRADVSVAGGTPISLTEVAYRGDGQRFGLTVNPAPIPSASFGVDVAGIDFTPGSITTFTATRPMYVRLAASGPRIPSNDPTGSQSFSLPPGSTMTVSLRFRALAFFPNFGKGCTQLCPVWDQTTDTVSAMSPPAGQNDFIELRFTVTPGSIAQASVEIPDPRLSGRSSSWVTSDPANGNPASVLAVGNTFGAPNNSTPAALQNSLTIRFLDFFQTALQQSCNTPIGMASSIPTGMQRGIPGSNFVFGPSADTTELPDWLILDLIAPALNSNPLSAAGSGSPLLSAMNSTMGRINLNSAIYPVTGVFTPPDRTLPLDALLDGLPNATTIASNIRNNTRSGMEWGAQGRLDYIGEVCEITGVADSGADAFAKDKIIRFLSNLITTKSNVFTVWGTSQSIRKVPKNMDYGNFQSGDAIAGERRFRAVIERYVWPGIDGIAGYGSLTSGGLFQAPDISTAATALPGGVPAAYPGARWDRMDGPENITYTGGTGWTAPANVPYSATTLNESLNPVGAHMRYRVVDFEFLQ